MFREKINKSSVGRILNRLPRVKILIVGDLILDHYIWGEAERLSPEAPVPVVKAMREEYLLGGACNVAHNLVSLGAKASVGGVIGKDFPGQRIERLLEEVHIDNALILKQSQRPTTLKTRIVASHQQVVRIDWESEEFLDFNLNKRLMKLIKERLEYFDALIIEDYGKGVINPQLLDDLVGMTKKKGKIITVDPKEEHFDYYRGVNVLTPNLKEAASATGIKVRSHRDIDLIGESILSTLKPEALVVTMGNEGMRIFEHEKEPLQLPTLAKEVYDVSGAGDTVIAVLTASLAVGSSYAEAAFIANVAAGIVVEKLGVGVAGLGEIKERIKSLLTA